MRTPKKDPINPWETANRTKKVNKVLAVLPHLPNTREAIIDGTLSLPDWDRLARIAGVIPCGKGARAALRTILSQMDELDSEVVGT